MAGAARSGRLTAELVQRSPQGLNALRDYELDLRGNKIAAIENLGATENQFDSIDLSDNEVVKLDGFPVLTRLTMLLLNNNRITRISDRLGASLPRLTTLVLSGNRLLNLTDLLPLAALPRLLRLSLLDNPVAKRENYRAYVVHKCRALKLLDFQKVKPAERAASDAMFADEEGAAAREARAKTFVPGEPEGGAGPAPERKGPSAAQVTALKAAIAAASTLDEVARLEAALKGGTAGDMVLPDEAGPGGGGANGQAAMEEG